MKCRVKRSTGFRPINVRLRFDNIVEYECFKTLMGFYGDTSISAIPRSIADRFTGMISMKAGVKVSRSDVEQCIKSMMARIYKRLPAGKEGM